LATAFLAVAVLDERRWAWVGVGAAVGVGALAKYGALLWPIGMFAFLLLDRRSRRWLRTPWPYLAVGIALLFLIPPIVWNVRHDWVTFKHVAKQTGASAQKSAFNGNFFELVGSQIGVVGPALTVILVAAIVYAFRRQRELKAEETLGETSAGVRWDRAVVLLLWTGLPLFASCVLGSIRSKMQVNWPAAAYFSWMILAGYFLSTRLAAISTWRRWRPWLYATAIYGLALMPIAHNSEILYPALNALNSVMVDPLEAREFDFAAKLKGWAELGARVSRELKAPGLVDPIILCEDYKTTAEMAFYVDGHPKTFCIGPYVEKVEDRKRRSQYDVWPDRSLEQPSLRGRDAIYVGHESDDLPKAFKSVQRLEDVEIWRRGQKTRRFRLFLCKDFQGMTLKDPAGAF
jgi:hypothetical protein